MQEKEEEEEEGETRKVIELAKLCKRRFEWKARLPLLGGDGDAPGSMGVLLTDGCKKHSRCCKLT